MGDVRGFAGAHRCSHYPCWHGLRGHARQTSGSVPPILAVPGVEISSNSRNRSPDRPCPLTRVPSPASSPETRQPRGVEILVGDGAMGKWRNPMDRLAIANRHRRQRKRDGSGDATREVAATAWPAVALLGQGTAPLEGRRCGAGRRCPPNGGCAGARALKSCITSESPRPSRASQSRPDQQGALRWRPGPLRAPLPRADLAAAAQCATVQANLPPKHL